MRIAVLVLGALAACAKPPPPGLEWVRGDEAAAFSRARSEHKGVLIHVFASWAMQSQEVERVLETSSVRAVIAPSFVPLLVDVTEPTPATEALQARYDANTIPAIVLVGTDGTVLGRIKTAVSPDELRTSIESAARDLRRP